MSGVRSLGGLFLPPALGRVGGRPAPQTTGKDTESMTPEVPHASSAAGLPPGTLTWFLGQTDPASPSGANFPSPSFPARHL